MPSSPSPANQAKVKTSGWWRPAKLWPWLIGAGVLRLLVGVGLYIWAWRVSPGRMYAILTTLNTLLQAQDATGYHLLAMRCLDFWKDHPYLVLSLPDRYLGYPILLGGVYYLLGPHPLWGVFVNCLAFLGVGWLAHGLALRLGQPAGRAKALALLVALWPPSLAYSSTLLKDSLTLLALFGLLAALASLLQSEERPLRQSIYSGLGLLGSGYLMVVLRPDLAVLALATGLTGGVWALVRAWPHPARRFWPVLATCLLVAIAVWSGRELTPVKFVPHTIKSEASAVQSGQPAQLDKPAPPPAASTGGPPSRESALSPAQESSYLGAGFWSRRWEFAQAGGISLSPEAFVLPDGVHGMAAIGWGALRDLLLFPYPWQRWPAGGGNALLGAVISAQAVLWYALLPGLLWGVAAQIRRLSPAAGVVLAWVAFCGLVTGLVVVNLGTLYRVRDLALLPLLICFTDKPYRWLAGRLGLGEMANE